MTRADDPAIDIAVCVHDALHSIQRCLASLRRASGPPFRLILVDDGSSTETASWLSRFASSTDDVRLLRNRNAVGYTKAANLALRASTAPFVVLLNSDTRVSRHWLRLLLAGVTSRDSVGIAGPLSNAASWQSVPRRHGDDGDWCVNRLPPRTTVDGMAEIVRLNVVPEFPVVPFVNGFCLLLDRRVIERVGYFDEQHFGDGFGEEIDFCLRAGACGFESVVADHAFVYHAKSQSYGHVERRRLAAAARLALRHKHGDALFESAIAAIRDNAGLAARRAAVELNYRQLVLATVAAP